MVFQRKASFFLDLSGDAPAGKPAPVKLAVREEAAQPAAQDKPAAQPQAAAAAPAAASTAAPAPSLTTAEAIAAELRAAQEARPAATLATFAPDCLNPANALPRRRRRAGANLAGFKAMGSSLFRSK